MSGHIFEVCTAAWVWPFPLHVASELIFWPSADVMRLALVSPAVPLAFLAEEVLGLGTGKYSQAFLRCWPTTHSLWTGRKSGRNPLPAEATGRPTSSAFPTPGLHAESGIQCHRKGGAGQLIQVGSPGLWVSPPQILANV